MIARVNESKYKMTLLVLPQLYAEVVVDESMVLTNSRQNLRGLTDWVSEILAIIAHTKS